MCVGALIKIKRKDEKFVSYAAVLSFVGFFREKGRKGSSAKFKEATTISSLGFEMR